MNKVQRPLSRAKSIFLFAQLYLLLDLAAWGLGGFGFALAVALAIIPFYLMSFRISPSLISTFFRGRELKLKRVPRLEGTLLELSDRAGLENSPRLYLVPGSAMSAFAVGNRRDSAIGLSHGLIRGLDNRELAGVLAHEIIHVSHGDTRAMLFSALLRRMIGILALFAGLLAGINLFQVLIGNESFAPAPLLVLLLAPTLGSLMMYTVSRRVEFNADTVAAEILGDTEPLACALEKIGQNGAGGWERIFSADHYLWSPLMRTHPATEERVQRLHRQTLSGPFVSDPLFDNRPPG